MNSFFNAFIGAAAGSAIMGLIVFFIQEGVRAWFSERLRSYQNEEKKMKDIADRLLKISAEARSKKWSLPPKDPSDILYTASLVQGINYLDGTDIDVYMRMWEAYAEGKTYNEWHTGMDDVFINAAYKKEDRKKLLTLIQKYDNNIRLYARELSEVYS